MKKAFLFDANETSNKLALEWCAKNHVDLCGELSHQNIEVGSYLLVNRLSYVTKETLHEMVSVFNELLGKGLIIVNLDGGEIIKTDYDVMYIAGAMALYNKKSTSKSECAHKSWEEKRARIEEGNRQRLRHPSWITQANDTYVLNDKASVVELVFETYLECGSINHTAKLLNERNIDTIGRAKSWGLSSVRSVLNNKSSYGALESKTIQCDGFYPSVITKNKFLLAQKKMKEKSKTGSADRGRVSNLLSGLATCGVCGSSLSMHGKRIELSDGEIGDYRYLVCSKSLRNTEKCTLPNFRYMHVEDSICLFASEVSNANQDLCDDGFYKFIGNAKFKIHNPDYRKKFMASLNQEVEKCTFLLSGDIEMRAFGREVVLSGLNSKGGAVCQLS